MGIKNSILIGEMLVDEQVITPEQLDAGENIFCSF